MNRKTLAALKKSIKHWEGMRDGAANSGTPGSNDCPLCRLFLVNAKGNKYDCEGCPIAEKTGSKHCNNTPYNIARFTWADNYEFPSAAQDEIDFLRSLLPKKHKRKLDFKDDSTATDGLPT